MSEGAATFRVDDAAYDRYMGRYSAPLAAALADAAGIRTGVRALDVGCGPGALTAELARRLGASSVAAVDPSEPFVEACRRRNPGVDVRVVGAESLPFADGSVDAALAQLVVNFMTDPAAGIAEMARVVRAGGVVGACVWDYGDGMRMLRVFWDAALALDPEAPDEGRTMRFARRGELAELFRDAGLAEVADGALDVEAAYESFEDFWQPFTAGVGPGGAHCASLDPDRQALLREDVRHRLGRPQGGFTLPARAWYATGRP